MGPILVFGHRNPDTDSICSAIALAHLRNLTDPGRVYVPARLGPVPPECEWVLERFGLEPPAEIGHVRMRVGDAMSTEIVSVPPDATLLSVGRVLADRGVRALPVVAEGRVLGLVTMQALAKRYVDDLTVSGFAGRPVEVGRLVETLDGELLAGDATALLSGKVLIAAMEPETMLSYIGPGDTLIVGDRRRTQPMALEAGVACLVVTGGHRPDAAVLALAEEKGAAVVVTGTDSYGAARLMNLGHAASDMMDTDILTVEPDTLLSEATEDLLSTAHREAVVMGPEGELAGLLTRTNIARSERREVVLVDHNEIAQSADGIEEAAVVEIVDHHRVGDVETTSPVRFLGMPVGSTASVIAMEYRRLEIDPDEPVAGVMLAAVLSDTVMLKSPTTTDEDRDIAEWLAGELGVDAMEFGMEMFRQRSARGGFSAQRAVRADLKEYRVGESRVAVAQTETVDAEDVLAHRDELSAEMQALAEARGYDVVLLMVTDVVREGSELLVAGKQRVAERAFGVPFEGGSAWFDGMLSRKKQVAPLLLESAGR